MRNAWERSEKKKREWRWAEQVDKTKAEIIARALSKKTQKERPVFIPPHRHDTVTVSGTPYSPVLHKPMLKKKGPLNEDQNTALKKYVDKKSAVLLGKVPEGGYVALLKEAIAYTVPDYDLVVYLLNKQKVDLPACTPELISCCEMVKAEKIKSFIIDKSLETCFNKDDFLHFKNIVNAYQTCCDLKKYANFAQMADKTLFQTFLIQKIAEDEKNTAQFLNQEGTATTPVVSSGEENTQLRMYAALQPVKEKAQATTAEQPTFSESREISKKMSPG